jgi:cysteine-rich repeat protein
MRRLVVGSLPLLTSCLLWVDFEDKPEGGGGSGGSVAASGGAPAGGGPVGGGPAGGGPAGGGGTGLCGEGPYDQNPDACGEPGYDCGPGAACCSGVCQPVRTPLSPGAPAVEVAAGGDKPVVRRGATSGMTVLEPWTGPEFDMFQAETPLSSPEEGNGYLGGGSQVLYRPQLDPGCPAVGTDACLSLLHFGPTPCLKLLRWQVAPNEGGHINGAVATKAASIYFLPANARRLFKSTVEIDCDPQTLPPDVVVASMTGDNPSAKASLLALDLVGPNQRLWWTTVTDGDGGGAIFSADPAALGQNVSPWIPPNPVVDYRFIRTSEASLFVSEDPSTQVVRFSKKGAATAGAFPTAVRHPFASDRDRLYGVDPEDPSRVLVLKFSEMGGEEFGVVVGEARAEPGETILAMDAGLNYLYFLTDQALYRWRKPRCSVSTECGDGCVTGAEECDDGNVDSGDGCDANCTFTACGNDIVTGVEECDDGDVDSGDGCDANCTFTACGNDIVTGVEECDDGNTSSGDGCSATCEFEP